MSNSTAAPCRVVVLVSGSGSNLQAVIDNAAHNYKVVAVISNRPKVFALQRAKQANIPALVLDHQEFSSRELFDNQLRIEIDKYNPDLVVLAGFMRILTPAFVRHYTGRIINIHPSLLPKYTGINTHQRALDAGDAVHGVSVHFVTAELDGGPIIAQAQVAIEANDDADTLAKRVLTQEHRLYPEVVSLFASGRLKMNHASQNAGVLLDGAELPSTGFLLDSSIA